MEYAEKEHKHRGIDTPTIDYDKLKSIPAALGYLYFCDTEVFSGDSTAGWVDLDLSGTIGVNSAIVMLRVNRGAGSFACCVRQNGDTIEYMHSTLAERGGVGMTTALDSSTPSSIVICKTDSAGVIEHKENSADYAMTIDLLAYIKLK